MVLGLAAYVYASIRTDDHEFDETAAVVPAAPVAG